MIVASLVAMLLGTLPMVHSTPAAASLPAAAASTTAATADGGRIYAARCASCHGAQQWGTGDGPSLRGVGTAALDFYLSTGRMPAAVPWLQVGDRDERSGQRLSENDIRAVEAYLAPIVAGGPALPLVTAAGNVDRGRRLFSVNCQHCHAFSGDGGAVGELAWAPSLHRATINVVAEAMRVGPGEMPRFGEQQLTQSDLNDVASYVMTFRKRGQPADAPPFRSTGPVPEGAIGYVAIIALVAFVFIYWRSDTPAAKREESVRRDEGVQT